jgi:hypothetical protein
MQSFDLEFVLTPSFIIFIATLWVAFKVTRSPVFSLSAAAVKAGVFLCYFCLLFDGTFTFVDDWNYLEGGQELLAQGIGLTNLADNWDFALVVGAGDHFVYYLFNTYAFRLFGQGYYAPVALNVLLTLLVAWIGAHLAQRELSFSRGHAQLFFAFLLLHPDILAWSNIMNSKDVLVLLLHVLLLYSASLFFQLRIWSALLLAVPVSVVLLFVRFYVPVLFAIALMACLFVAGKGRGRLRLLTLGAGMSALVAMGLGEEGFQYALFALQEHLVNPVYGFVRMVLTPIPFNTDENYAFLDIPAAIHWFLMPFVGLGVMRVYRIRTTFSRFFLAYVLVFFGLYAVFGELQGPRHRVQLDYAWAVFQFMGMMEFLNSVLRRRRQSLMDPPAEALLTGT